MKKGFYYIIFAVLPAFFACNTDVENIGYKAALIDYEDYEALRAYKASDHELLFGWYGGWNAGGASMGYSLRTLPDSVDLVSIWGAWQNPLISKQSKDELKYMREVRGTRFLATIFTPRLGDGITPEGEDPNDFWGWDSNDKEKQKAAYQKYADSLCRLVIELGYDGMDWDNEQFNSAEINQWMFDVISQYMGPLSGTDRLFCIDGYFWRTTTDGLTADMYKYVDYFIAQAYYSSGYTDLDNRFRNYANFWMSGVDPEGNMSEEEKYRDLARKFIVTEDFERHSHDGGPSWSIRGGGTTRSSLGMAGWHPQYNGEDMRKGGAGVYHMELDYGYAGGEYYWVRQMIQIMNPAGGSVPDVDTY